MKMQLKILILEDLAADAELMESELRRGDIVFTSKRVETRENFLNELKSSPPDIVLADYNLPSFDGLAALSVVREQHPEIPFVFVSGTVGEEIAIEAIKKGATDYVRKERLHRLVPVVLRAMREAEMSHRRKLAEEALKKNEKELKKRIQELEEFYDIAIGRELRMMELKRENEKLREELEQCRGEQR
jgi:DNA-binding NtrC family response regulator